MTVRSTLAAAVVALALLGGAASCSDDDDDGATPAAGGGATTTAATTDGSAAAPADDDARGGAAAGEFPGDEWETTTPDEAGLDQAVLDELAEEAEAADSNCLLVAREGRIVAEWYWNGTAEDSAQEVFSATKSFTSLLVGIAQDDGSLDIGESASRWIPEWKGTPAEEVTVRNLLSNDSGRFWSAQNDYGAMVASPDKTAFSVGLEQTDPPGTVWAYNNSAIQTLEQVLEGATGEPVPAFMEERLLDPIGMDDSELNTDEAGNGLTFMGLHSTCRDMARFGHLVLEEGTWDGEQVVSSEWIEEATGASSQELNAAYGYLWWLNRPGRMAGAMSPTRAEETEGAAEGQMVPDAPEDLVWALGLGGQTVQVHRPTGTVAVRLGPANMGSAYGPAQLSRVVTEAVVE